MQKKYSNTAVAAALPSSFAPLITFLAIGAFIAASFLMPLTAFADVRLAGSADDDRDDRSEESSDELEDSDGVVTVDIVPLLWGGTARSGESVPVMYLQLRNVGDETITIEGFTLEQNGTAPTSVIETLSTVDDKGGSRATSDEEPFEGEDTGFAPSGATIEPGALKLFTIKADLASSISSSAGKNLKLDVVGVETNGSVEGDFPLRGTTWTIGF